MTSAFSCRYLRFLFNFRRRSVAYCQEIYRDSIIDLLSANKKTVNLRGSNDGSEVHLPGLLQSVKTEAEAYNLLFEGDSRRHFERLPANAETSRGHVFFQLHISHGGRDAVLAFVDVAAPVSTQNHATESVVRSLRELRSAARMMCAGLPREEEKSLGPLTRLLLPWLQPREAVPLLPALVTLLPLKWQKEDDLREAYDFLQLIRILHQAAKGRLSSRNGAGPPIPRSKAEAEIGERASVASPEHTEPSGAAAWSPWSAIVVDQRPNGSEQPESATPSFPSPTTERLEDSTAIDSSEVARPAPTKSVLASCDALRAVPTPTRAWAKPQVIERPAQLQVEAVQMPAARASRAIVQTAQDTCRTPPIRRPSLPGIYSSGQRAVSPGPMERQGTDATQVHRHSLPPFFERRRCSSAVSAVSAAVAPSLAAPRASSPWRVGLVQPPVISRPRSCDARSPWATPGSWPFPHARGIRQEVPSLPSMGHVPAGMPVGI